MSNSNGASSPFTSRLARIAGFALAFASLAYILLFLVLAVVRLRYPFELEWIEGAYVDESRWILAGNPPYGAPSIYYLPTSKTPLFFYLSAALMKVLGEGFLAPRLLSILSTAGCFLLLYLLASQAGDFPASGKPARHPVAGLLAAGLYAATFRLSGAWMDLAKTDALFLFLLLLAYWVGARAGKPWHQWVCGALFALAFLTKQLALVVVLALAPISLFVSRGRAWQRWLVAAALGLAAFFALQATSQGWFSFFTFATSLQHERVTNIWLFWKSLLVKFWPAALLALVYLAAHLRAARQARWLQPQAAWNHIGLAGALVLTSWSIYFKTWTYDNGFMPACLGLALLGGLGYAELERRSGAWGVRAPLAGALLALAQLAMLLYSPAAQLPTQSDRQAAQSFLERLNNLPGEVWVFNHGFINHLVGKTTYLHSAPLGDVLGGALPAPGSNAARQREQVTQMFEQAISSQRFDWVIVDQMADFWLPYYVSVQKLRDEFYPVTGARTRPSLLLARNPLAHGGRFPFSDPSSQKLLSGAWQEIEGQGRWMDEGGGELQVALAPASAYRLVIQAQADCPAGQPTAQSLQVSWNDEPIASLAFTSCAAGQADLVLPTDMIAAGANELHLQPGLPSGASQPARVKIELIEFTSQ